VTRSFVQAYASTLAEGGKRRGRGRNLKRIRNLSRYEIHRKQRGRKEEDKKRIQRDQVADDFLNNPVNKHELRQRGKGKEGAG